MTLPIPHAAAARPAAAEPEPGPDFEPETVAFSQRHEDFCLAFTEYANAAVAARWAGYAPASSHNQGYRLLKRSDIRARIGEIRQTMGEEGCAGRDILLGKLETVYNRALEDHHFTAAVARPVGVQIADGGNHAVGPPAKDVQVALVEGSGRVVSKVGFVLKQAKK